MQPFTCPHCGSHDYTLVLSGCTVSNATLQETYNWDEKGGQYMSVGTILADSDEVEPEITQAFCAACEKDVTDAVAEHQAAQAPSEEAASA